jgi:hypothetical protein
MEEQGDQGMPSEQIAKDAFPKAAPKSSTH